MPDYMYFFAESKPQKKTIYAKSLKKETENHSSTNQATLHIQISQFPQKPVPQRFYKSAQPVVTLEELEDLLRT